MELQRGRHDWVTFTLSYLTLPTLGRWSGWWKGYVMLTLKQDFLGLPGSSAGKESTCNAGDSSSIAQSGRSTEEGISYPLRYSWASLVAQLVKNLPAMRETWVWSLGWEDPLEKGKASHSSILVWRHPWIVQSKGLQRVGHERLSLKPSRRGSGTWAQ